MLCKRKTLMRFSNFTTINSIISNEAELRRYSRNVVGFPMENRPPMTKPDVTSYVPYSNEECEPLQGCTPRTPPARGPAVVDFKSDLQLNSTTRLDGRLSSPAIERIDLLVGQGANCIRAGRLSRHQQDGKSRRMPGDQMLWKGTALMRFAPFSTINSLLSNAAELRLPSCNVVEVPMEGTSDDGT
jgi:hypothetical protein